MEHRTTQESSGALREAPAKPADFNECYSVASQRLPAWPAQTWNKTRPRRGAHGAI